MDPERARRLEQLYHSALEHAAADRAAFLKSACGPDLALREEVESLLTYDEQAENFIEEPALEVAARLLARQQKMPPKENNTAFAGQIVSHYRIAEKLGGGGMGVVYKARDTRLGRAVALKFLPGDFASDPTAVLRFQREARAASSLNHPNICTIYDIGEEDGRAFIAMEYLDGQTLKHTIESCPLESDRILQLATQIAGTLEAAHAQGIIHRDVKPANIFVTQSGQAKVLDFGLAKRVATRHKVATGFAGSGLLGGASEEPLTSPGIAIGTVAYMSPEQARGEEVDVRTDLFSFGAVLYEMATGQRAFSGNTTAVVFDALLNRDPVAAASVNPHLPEGLDPIITKALRKNRQERYQSAAEMLADLKAVQADPLGRPKQFMRPIEESAAMASSSYQRRLRTARAATACLLVVALIVSYLAVRHRRKVTSPAVIPSRRSVAVLGLRNLSGKADVAWLSTALSEMMTTELAAGEKLRTVSGEDVARARASLPLPDADSLGRDTLDRVHKSLGTDFVVLGSYLDLAGQIRLDLRLQDANAGETIATVSAEGSEGQLLDLVSRAGEQLRQRLGVQVISDADAVRARASQPSNPNAARLYAQGLVRLRADDALAARDLLQEAIAAEPQYPLSHATLARAWTALGYDQKAKAEATKAFQLSGNLAWEDRLAVEGRYRAVIGDWDKAIVAYRALFALFPDNLDYGLDLAQAQYDAGKLGDALSALDDLRKLPSPSRDDPRIDLLTASAAGSDHAKALTAAEQAAQKGLALDAKWVVARARGNQCAQYAEMGQLNESFAACQEAKQIYAATGDRNGVGKELNDLAYICIEQGKLAEAKELFQEALVNFRAIGNDEGVATTLANLGATVYSAGGLAEAQQIYRDALPMYRKVEDTEGESFLLVNLGELLMNEGKLHEATDTCRQGLAIAQRTGDKRAIAYVLSDLGELLLIEGDLAGARKSYEQSLAARQEIGEKSSAAESRTYLAELAIEEGNASAAEKLAGDAVREFQNDQQADDELTAAAVLIDAQIAQGKWADAQATVDAESALATKNQNQVIGPKFAIAAARSLAASGKVSKARSSLETVLEDATKTGFVVHELEARLALNEIDLKSGKTSAGRAHLAVLEKDASAKGFTLIAHKASARIVQDN